MSTEIDLTPIVEVAAREFAALRGVDYDRLRPHETNHVKTQLLPVVTAIVSATREQIELAAVVVDG